MTVQETAQDIGQYVTEQLTQREVSARAWERQSNEWEELAGRQREALGLAERAIVALNRDLAAAHALIADLESRLGEAQQGLYVMEESNAE